MTSTTPTSPVLNGAEAKLVDGVPSDGGYQTAPGGNARFLIARQPVGPCLLITPWSFPMAALTVGRGTSDGVDVGPLIDAAALEKVSSLVADAVERGAKVLTGGEVAEGKGYFYPPTVLTGVPRDARRSDE